jgi:lysophospholipase L1-like esterase
MGGSRLRDGDRVVCVGDSITADPQGYVAFAREVLRLSGPGERPLLINAGVCGETAADMQRRFERDALERRPTWVTLSAGPNDAAHGVPLGDYARAVTAMVAAAEGAGARVGLCTPTLFEPALAGAGAAPVNERIAGYEAWLQELAAERNVLVIPMFEAFRLALEASGPDEEPWLTCDGVHPSPAGRYLMGLTFLAAFGVSLPVESGEGPAD